MNGLILFLWGVLIFMLVGYQERVFYVIGYFSVWFVFFLVIYCVIQV